MNAVDTNVLIYVHDQRDVFKQQTAAGLVTSLSDGVLLWQVACEYLSASRKLEPFGYSREKAWQDIHDLRKLWRTVLPSWNVIDQAYDLLKIHSLSYWDAMILAACLAGGVRRIYTEDFDAYPRIQGIEVVNPFRSTP
jgi:predicted nucleic acid-binding protein